MDDNINYEAALELTSLIEATDDIQKYYDVLCSLECSFKYKSKVYLETIEKLKIAVIKAKDIFNRISNDLEKNKLFLGYIKSKLSRIIKSDEEIVLYHFCYGCNSEELKYLRLFNLFSYKIITDKKHIEDNLTAFDFFASQIVGTSKETIINQKIGAINLQYYLALDLVNFSLPLLQESSNKNPLRDIVIKNKYMLSLLIPEIESELLSRNFEINPNPFLVNAIVSIKGLSFHSLDELRDSYIYNSILKKVKVILATKDEYLEDLELLVVIEKAILDVRALLVMSGEEKYEFLIDIIKKEIDESTIEDNRIMKSKLEEALTYFESDVERPQILALLPPLE